MLLGTAIAGFLQHLRVVRRLSGHTVAGYGRDLRALERALPGATVEGVGGRMVRRAIAVDGGLGAASIARRLSAWRSFFDYWAGREVVRVNPVVGVRGPRRAVRLPRALTPEEMGAVLGTTRGEGWLACRDRAVMELLYSSGVRLGELVRLDVTDVDLRAGVAVVREGKGGHGRGGAGGTRGEKGFGGVAGGAAGGWWGCDRWRSVCEPTVDAVGGTVGAAAVGTTTEGVADAVECAWVPGILVRLIFCSRVGDLRATQELLGHRNIASTQIYTRLDYQHLGRGL